MEMEITEAVTFTTVKSSVPFRLHVWKALVMLSSVAHVGQVICFDRCLFHFTLVALLSWCSLALWNSLFAWYSSFSWMLWGWTRYSCFIGRCCWLWKLFQEPSMQEMEGMKCCQFSMVHHGKKFVVSCTWSVLRQGRLVFYIQQA